MNRKSLVRNLIRFGIPAALVWVALTRIDIADAARELRSTSPRFLILAVIVLGVSLGLRVVRWYSSLSAMGLDHSWRVVLRSFALGFSGSAVVGEGLGALGRTYDLRSDGAPTRDVLAALFLDKGYEILTLVLLVFPAALALPESALDIDSWVLGVIGVLVLVAVVVPFTPVGGRALAAIARRFDGKQRPLATLAEALQRVRARDHARILALSVGARTTQFAYAWLLALAIGVDIGYGTMAAVMTAVGFVVLLPISIGGLGVREVTMLGFFEAFGLSAASAVAVSLLIFTSTMAVRLAIGLAWAATRSHSADPAAGGGDV